jgi:phage gp36-like protein
MGAYINQPDIEKRIEHRRLVQLTDDAQPPSGNVDVDVVAEAITEAEGRFEASARAAGYALPVPVTQMVRSICLDIATFKLFERRATLKDGVYEAREKAFDKAVKFLEALSARKVALDVPAAEETVAKPATGDVVLSGPSEPETFSKGNLRGF